MLSELYFNPLIMRTYNVSHASWGCRKSTECVPHGVYVLVSILLPYALFNYFPDDPDTTINDILVCYTYMLDYVTYIVSVSFVSPS